MAHAKILNRDRQLIPEFFGQVSLKEVGGLISPHTWALTVSRIFRYLFFNKIQCLPARLKPVMKIKDGFQLLAENR
jgi:hypothetical protein